MTSGKTSRARETLRIFRDSGALLEDDHFVNVSGNHSSGWVAKDLLFPDPAKPRRLGELTAAAVHEAGIEPAVVCGPATGGLISSQWVAYALGALSVFTEHDPLWEHRDGDRHDLTAPFVLRRGYDEVVRDAQVLVIDDIVNTGHSIVQTLAAVRAAGGEVVGAAAFISRGNVGADELGVNTYLYLAECHIPSWPAVDCSLCREGVPVNTRYAHGAEFVATHGPT